MNHENQREALLHRITAEDFALYEALLYLDGHPKCKKALRYYEEHKKILLALREEYEKSFGPLTMYGNQEGDQWRWVETPWPWEKEGN